MIMQYAEIAGRARSWSTQPGLSDTQRTLCEVVAGLADALMETTHALPEAREDLRLLSCHLCRRAGESVCFMVDHPAHSHPEGDCPLGFQEAFEFKARP